MSARAGETEPATFDRLKSVTDNSPLAFRNDKLRLKLIMSFSKHTTNNTNKDKKKVRARKTKGPMDFHTAETGEESFRLLLREHLIKTENTTKKTNPSRSSVLYETSKAK